jgi:phage recombination protein Bet
MDAATAEFSRQHELTGSEPDMVQVLQGSLYPGCDPEMIKLALAYCKAAGLDPLQKPVHIVQQRDPLTGEFRATVIPGIGLYRTIAARCGCAGVDEPDFGPEVTERLAEQQITHPHWCRVTVRRRLPTGEIVLFTAKEFWSENVASHVSEDGTAAPSEIWRRRPFGQLAKCAEAQALRKAFPEIGAQPAAEELEGKVLLEPSPAASAPSRRRKPDVRMPTARSDVPAQSALALDGAAVEETLRAEPPQKREPAAAQRQEARSAAARTSSAATAPEPADGRAPSTLDSQIGVESASSLSSAPADESSVRTDIEAAAAAACSVIPTRNEGGRAPSPRCPMCPLPLNEDGTHAAPLSAGEQAYLLRRILAKGMTVEQACAAAGLGSNATLECLTRAGFAALRELTA